jgi:hypothetical protein
VTLWIFDTDHLIAPSASQDVQNIADYFVSRNVNRNLELAELLLESFDG